MAWNILDPLLGQNPGPEFYRVMKTMETVTYEHSSSRRTRSDADAAEVPVTASSRGPRSFGLARSDLATLRCSTSSLLRSQRSSTYLHK